MGFHARNFMNFDVLYSIAIDLINKKRANNWNFSHSDFVCVLMSGNNNIFTGMSVSDIKNGKLVSSCAEYETIKVMMGSNETKIKAMATVNVSSLMPTLPCDDCKKLIVEVNPENSDCMIMKPDNTFCALKDIGTDVNDDVWGMGWDDDDSFGAGASVGSNVNMEAFSPNMNATQSVNPTDTSNTDNPMPNNPVAPNKFGTASVYTSRYVDNPMPNNPMQPNMVTNAYNSSMYSRYNPMPNSPISPNMVGSSMYNSNYITSNYVNPLQNSPMNQSAINMGNSSTLKAVSIDFNPLAYQNENSNKENTSTLQTVSLKQSGTLNQQPTEAGKNVFKERLKNIIADEDIMEDGETTPPPASEPIEDVTSKPHRFGKPKDKDKDKDKSKEKSKDKEPEKVSTNGLSKKELKALAKEKKKQAKKNSKILEAMEKQQKK
jgi:cytidine deaminase